MQYKKQSKTYPAKSVPGSAWRVIYFRQVSANQAVERINTSLADAWRALGGYFSKITRQVDLPPLQPTDYAAWRLAGICPSKEGKEHPRFMRVRCTLRGVGFRRTLVVQFFNTQN